MIPAAVALDGQTLTPQALAEVAHGAAATFPADARARMAESAAWLAGHATDPLEAKWRWLSGIDAPSDPVTRVRTFLRGHCAGVGPPLPRHEARALMGGSESRDRTLPPFM